LNAWVGCRACQHYISARLYEKKITYKFCVPNEIS
jgi:hypothetical protein